MKEEVWVTYAFLPACLTIIWSKKLISDSLSSISDLFDSLNSVPNTEEIIYQENVLQDFLDNLEEINDNISIFQQFSLFHLLLLFILFLFYFPSPLEKNMLKHISS